MNAPSLSIADALECLSRAIPPRGVVHIGAGTGSFTSQYRSWNLERVILVDAEPTAARQLSALAAGHTGWAVHESLVAQEATKAKFFAASHSAESGLVAPGRLASFWRNLHVVEERQLEAITIDSLVPDEQREDFNWVVVECLPAVPVLRGASSQLASTDVVLARVCLDAATSDLGASKTAVDEYLEDRGFECAGQQEERHPAFALALYIRARDAIAAVQRRSLELERQVRDLEESLRSAARARDEQSRVVRELQSKVADVTKSREQGAQLASQLRQQIEQLTKDRDEQARIATRQQQQAEQLTKARDDQARLAIERQKLLEQLTKARDEQAQLAIVRQQQVEQLTKARDEQGRLANERLRQLEHITSARDEQAELAAERQRQLEQLTEARDEHSRLATARQQQLEQLSKARDEQARLATERQRQLEEVTKARDEQAHLAAQRQQQVERLTKACDEQSHLASRRQQQLEQVTRARDEQTQLVAQRQQQLEEFSRQLGAQAQTAIERQQEAEHLAKDRDKQAQLAAERHLRVEELTAARAKDSERLRELEQLLTAQQEVERQLAREKEQHEQARNRGDALDAELREARQTAALAVRMHTLREADLKDLQQRYAAASAAQERQHQLLLKLGERLRLASHYMHELHADDNALLRDNTRTVVMAAAGAGSEIRASGAE